MLWHGGWGVGVGIALLLFPWRRLLNCSMGRAVVSVRSSALQRSIYFFLQSERALFRRRRERREARLSRIRGMNERQFDRFRIQCRTRRHRESRKVLIWFLSGPRTPLCKPPRIPATHCCIQEVLLFLLHPTQLRSSNTVALPTSCFSIARRT
ncbi:hypothetical protein IWX90DRAFT_214923 [Phyllosticta citrichinensis]|uniref:Secreted protein n=1 Tax=Phyllosticta citrichinensis TaxID=1130410 RepID=A0ABR1XT83_9PEZI